jgi:hypothetical protein
MNTVERINKRRALGVRGLSVLFALGTLVPSSVWAWDGQTTGQVDHIQVYSDGSGFQFALVNGPLLCPTSGWAGFGSVLVQGGATADGIKAMLATLKEAKVAGLTVTVYANNNSPLSGRGCDVGAIDFGP